MMRAARLYGIGDLRCESVPSPGAPGPGEVRLAVRAAGICGSDLHNYRTGHWISRTPSIPGHEFAAEVLELGGEVNGLAVGDLVVADSRVTCGRCAACRAGNANVCAAMGYVGEVCDGGFAEYVTLPARQLLPVPAGIGPQVAALAEPLAVALHVIRRLEPVRGQPLVIAGAGPIGGLAALLLSHLGYGPLAIIERNPARAALVAAVSGATLIDSSDASLQDFAGKDGLSQAIEASGTAPLASALVGALEGRGRLAMVGLFHGELRLNANAVVERELDLRGCSVFCGEQREVMALLPALSDSLARIASPAIGLDELPAAYQRLIAGESAHLKTIVRP